MLPKTTSTMALHDEIPRGAAQGECREAAVRAVPRRGETSDTRLPAEGRRSMRLLCAHKLTLVPRAGNDYPDKKLVHRYPDDTGEPRDTSAWFFNRWRCSQGLAGSLVRTMVARSTLAGTRGVGCRDEIGNAPPPGGPLGGEAVTRGTTKPSRTGGRPPWWNRRYSARQAVTRSCQSLTRARARPSEQSCVVVGRAGQRKRERQAVADVVPSLPVPPRAP